MIAVRRGAVLATRARMTWLWGSLTAVALLWPDRVSGPLDGVPWIGSLKRS